MKKLLPFIVMLPLLLVTFTLTAQKQNSWTATSVDKTERLIPVKKQKDFNLQLEEIKSHLRQSGKQSKLSIPYPDGKFHTFSLEETQIMEPGLAAKFPNIKAYVGTNPETGDNIRISIGKDGFHAMVFSKNGAFFIDPISNNKDNNYQVYYKKDIDTQLLNKNFHEEEPIIADKQKFAEVKRKVESGLVERPSGTQLRTYRIAIAATGEYTQFHGGTVEGALSAMVTTMNRVNGIYERDIAVTMVIIDNNDQLIYTDASTDPFTNNSAGAFINEVQTEITNTIGSENFDIGHGFSTGAGGLASLGSVCVDNRKASGVTGLSQPIGDPYDVDYVAHEIGHQFGAPHTFNGVVGSCAGGNRSANSAYEPGSGTTIMAYAGICGSDNIQNNSDPYFHAASLDFMTVFSQDNEGNGCAQISETGNTLPLVEAGVGGFTIPINTPFQLNASATDADGDGLTYTWEQYDLGPAGNPNTPEDNAPLFRSFAPTADSFRIFPQLSDILGGTQTQGEILPFYTRDLSFRLTVRDDQAVAGVDYDDISFSVSDQAGAFIVEEFSGDYAGFSSVTVNWQVNNTDIAPVNAEFVDIYVSADGGQSFTELVVENTPNDGSQVVTLPNITTATAKFKVAASNNVFFNISSGVFSISESSDPTFTLSASNNANSYCQSDDVIFTIETQSIFNYSESIDLSIEAISGLSETFGNVTIAPGESTTLTLVNNGQTSGDFILNLTANSGSITKSVQVPFTITNDPVAPTIITPMDAATDLSIRPSISWDDTNIESTYNIEIATDSDFINVVESGSTAEKVYSVQNNLEGSTTYFVRVNTENNCGARGFDVISFTTAAIACIQKTPTDLPLEIQSNSPNSIESKIQIEESGEIESIEVSNITGTHTYISDLVFRLVSPSGTEVVLLSNICADQDNFSFSFSDYAENSDFPCPPVDGGIYQPESQLSAFAGQDIQGEWTLIIDDEFSQDGGELQSWGLDLCVANYVEPALLTPSNLTAAENDEGNVILDWTDNSDNETAFVLERSEGDSTNFQLLDEVEPNTTSYTDTSVEGETLYFYRIKAISNEDESSYSNIVAIQTMIRFPASPSNLEITVVNDYTAQLTWVDNATNETGYLVERATGSGSFQQVAELAANVEFFEEDLDLNEYIYRVLATNSRGNSGYSNEFSIGADVLSTNGKLNNKIILFPNPAKELLYLKNESGLQINTVHIRNTLGQIIQSVLISDNGNQIEIPIQSFTKGLYLLHIESNKGSIRKQLIIE